MNGDWGQSFARVRKVLTTANLVLWTFLRFLFSLETGLGKFPGLALNLRSSCLNFLSSWDHKHTPYTSYFGLFKDQSVLLNFCTPLKSLPLLALDTHLYVENIIDSYGFMGSHCPFHFFIWMLNTCLKVCGPKWNSSSSQSRCFWQPSFFWWITILSFQLFSKTFSVISISFLSYPSNIQIIRKAHKVMFRITSTTFVTTTAVLLWFSSKMPSSLEVSYSHRWDLWKVPRLQQCSQTCS